MVLIKYVTVSNITAFEDSSDIIVYEDTKYEIHRFRCLPVTGMNIVAPKLS